MAATGTPTPNIGLRIPQGTDPASVDDINYNSNLIDTKLGAVGNDSVQDQINSLSENLAAIMVGPYVPTDLDSIDRTCICYTNNTTLNRPADWCIVYTFAYSATTKAQLGFQISSDNMYFRRCNVSWQAWKKVTLTSV